MLLKGTVELPSDLHGVLHKEFDLKDAWQTKLRQELDSVGLIQN
jgi:predicted nucleotide-binding protein